MDNEQLSVIIQAVLEKSGLTKELSEIQNIVNNNMIKIIPKLETASLKNNLKEVSNLIAVSLNQSFKNVNPDFKITGNDVFKTITASMKELNTVSSVSQKRVTNLANSILAFKNNNSSMSKEISKSLDSMYKTLINGANHSETEIKELEARFSSLKLQVRESGDLGKSFSGKLKDNISNFMSWGFATGLATKGIQTLRDMYSAIYEIDTAMTNLYKVTDETDIRYSTFLSDACDNAKELGRTVSSLIEQTANWAKLGYSLDQSEELAKVSSIYANVGEVDDDTAVSDIVTAMKAFNLEASEAIDIVDKLNALGNKYAVSSADLGTGLSNSASALALAGNDINESLAMITAMSEITQDASESGNALKILSMRVRGYDEETQSYTNDVEELTGVIADLTKTAETPGGISLFTDDTKQTYKSTYDLLNEISKIWDDLSDKNKAELLEALAGKQRGNSIAALLTNMAQANNALNTSLNSSGSAYKEQERWMQSLEARTQRFEASFQSLSNSVINSDFAKGIIDLGTNLISLFDSIIDKTGVLIPLLSGAGITAFVKNFA